MYKVKRAGRRKITTILDDHLESIFSEVDNLDTKTFQEAMDSYEQAFVTTRDVLKKFEDEQLNLNSESARLTLCQEIVDSLRKSCLIRKDSQ